MTVSTASSTDKAATVYRKPRTNVYTVLLVISLLAIIVGCVFLYLFMADYDFKIKGGPTASQWRPAALAQASTDAATPVSILPL